MPVRPPTAAATDSALARVFARPEFAEPAPSPIQAFLSRAWDAVREFFRQLFPGVSLGETAGSAISWTLIVVLGVVGLVLAVGLLSGAAGAWRTRDRRRVAEDPEDGVAPVDETPAGKWEALARRAAAEGRWRDAALALYQALLLRLHDRGALRYDPAKTPGDYRRELRRRGGDTARALDGFLRGFEPVAFGGRGLDAQGYGALREAASQGGARG